MDWKQLLIRPEFTIREVLQIIENGGMQFSLHVDGDGRLLGVVADGDIRRALLQGAATSDSIAGYINPNPLTVAVTETPQRALKLMRESTLRHVPVVDEKGRIHAVWTLQDLAQASVVSNPVVLMAGGMGKRLGKLTEDCPKPLLKVGGKPILETIIETFSDAGMQNFWLSINYRAEMIQNHFGNGEKWGVSIQYLKEEKPLGTAGALSLLPALPDEPVIVMNGDILTKLSPQALLEAHAKGKGSATMVVKTYEMQVPYGVIQQDENKKITAIEEKPVERFFVSAGIYALSPSALRHIPNNEYLDMPDLFKLLMAKNEQPQCLELADYWIDIGHIADFQRANSEFKQYFEQ